MDTTPYDLERYKRIREISAEMVAHKSDIPAEKVKELFCNGDPDMEQQRYPRRDFQ